MPGIGRPVPYRYSYSGADARAFAYYSAMPDEVVFLESMHTISVSVHEGKGQARALGHRGIKGISRGIRTIAGSMIMTVIEDHPLKELLSLTGRFAGRESGSWGGWSIDRSLTGTGSAHDIFDFHNRLPTILPPFNLLVTYVSESSNVQLEDVFTSDVRFGRGPLPEDGLSGQQENLLGTKHNIDGAAMLIEGIEIIDTGFVTSVSDVVSEITISFLAKDHKSFSSMKGAFGTPTSVRTLPEAEIQNSIFKRLFGRKPNIGGRKNEADLELQLLNAGFSHEEVAAILFDDELVALRGE